MSMVMPTIRLRLQGMEHEIVMALKKHNLEIEEVVVDQVKHVIEHMDWHGEIRKQAMQAIEQAVRSSVERYFSHGGEGGKFVDHLVKNLFDLPSPDAPKSQ